MGVVYAAYDPQLDRKVAIKVLRPDIATDGQRQRIFREAQAMARVSHPNVMRVYDVGTVDDLVFISMELGEGDTLLDRLEATPLRWRDQLKLFVDAGRGLAAAHAVGLVHRDFKPANVLVGSDGAVRVIDFGLARADRDAVARPAELPDEIRESSGPTALDGVLTRAGAFMGTPLYMSPEQHRGEHTDARSDQFSFCVSLWHALYGEWPFPGDDLTALRAAVNFGEVAEPSNPSRAPIWVRRALTRGLSASPEQRWPSMDALLDHLERDPQARLRGQAAAVAGAAVLALSVAAWPLQRSRALTACERAADQVSQSWNRQRNDEVHRVFAATKTPFAEDMWRSSAKQLDTYSTDWAHMRREACVAANISGTQTQDQLAMRVACLDQRHQELETLVEVFAHADANVVQEAVASSNALSSIAACADPVALRSFHQPTNEPASRAKISLARRACSEAKSLANSGNIAAAVPKAREATRLARETGLGPLIAEALTREGDLMAKTGDRKQAEALLQLAIWFAQSSNADDLAARAWNRLGFIVGYELGRTVEGIAFSKYAAAVIARQGDNPELSADNRRVNGLVLEQEGKFDEALTQLQQSLELTEALYGPTHPAVATAASSVGNAYILMGQFDKALPYQERALKLRIEFLGPQHPDTSKSYHNLAICLNHLGEREAAISYLEKALAIDTAVFGPHNDKTATTRHTLAKAWLEAGQLSKAQEAAEMALRDLTAAFGENAPSTCPALLVLGRIALGEGRPAAALTLFRRGTAIREGQMGSESEVLLAYLTASGEASLALAQPHVALVDFEHAAQLKNLDRAPVEERAALAWGFARALWDSKADPSMALTRAVEAQRLYAQARNRTPEAELVEGWLEIHKRLRQ